MGFLDVISSLATPFLEHPVILFFLILLVVGADAYSVYGKDCQPVQLAFGEKYVIRTNVLTGEKWCEAGIGVQGVGVINATQQDIQTYCTCPDKKGFFGQSFTTIINVTGSLSKNSSLENAKVYSWELFVLMLATTFIVWAITASTRS